LLGALSRSSKPTELNTGSVMALDCALRRWGQLLVWRRGDPIAGLAVLARQHGARSIWTTDAPLRPRWRFHCPLAPRAAAVAIGAPHRALARNAGSLSRAGRDRWALARCRIKGFAVGCFSSEQACCLRAAESTRQSGLHLRLTALVTTARLGHHMACWFFRQNGL